MIVSIPSAMVAAHEIVTPFNSLLASRNRSAVTVIKPSSPVLAFNSVIVCRTVTMQNKQFVQKMLDVNLTCSAQ